MKKVFNFWSLAIILALCIGFLSCDNDDEPGGFSENIVGKWQLVEVNQNGNIYTEENPGSNIYYACDFRSWTEYKSDGTAAYFRACENITNSNGGTWKMEGNKLTMIDNDRPVSLVFTVITLTENELVVNYYIEEVATSIQKYKKFD